MKEPPELVMREGTSIEATGSGGTMRVVAGAGYERTYEWGACRLTAHPCHRYERWDGKLGIYDAAPGFAYLWKFCDGISRPVVEEAQLHFVDQASAQEWVTRSAQLTPGSTVWTTDGLVIQWDLVPGRNQLDVDVYQLCVRGSRPSALAGADDGAIKVIAESSGQPALFECDRVSDEVMRETAGGWTRHFDEIEKARPSRPAPSPEDPPSGR